MARLVPLFVQGPLGEPCALSGLALAQGRFAGHGMTVSSDGNDGDLMLSLTNKTTIRQQRCLEAASRPHHVLTQSMRCVGFVDITVGNAIRIGASQRSTTRRCASQRNARTAGDTRRFARV